MLYLLTFQFRAFHEKWDSILYRKSVFFYFFIALLLVSCSKPADNTVPTASHSDRENKTRPQLLMYCGITMIQPMQEVADAVSAKENCDIQLTKSGSGNLLESVRLLKEGDLFLAGSAQYVPMLEKEGFVTASAPVGYNQLALMVQKGNPRKISSDFRELMRRDLYIVLGNPESGSVGAETKRILEKQGIYTEVMQNVRELTPDSKRLTQVLIEKRADLVANWYAVSVWNENKSYLEALPIDEQYCEKKAIILARLACSKHPEIAQKVLDYTVSPAGQAIFKRYGFIYDAPSTPLP